MKPLKVQFGSGGNILPDFECWDSDVPIEKNLPYGDNTVDFILIEHCLEHVASPGALHFCEEAFRILKPGGVLRVCVPVIDRLERSSAKDIIRHHGHQIFFNSALVPTLLWAAGFDPGHIKQTDRKECDGHWKIIGEEKDTLETARFEATK